MRQSAKNAYQMTETIRAGDLPMQVTQLPF